MVLTNPTTLVGAWVFVPRSNRCLKTINAFVLFVFNVCGFNFNANEEQKIGVLRSFVRKNKNLEKNLNKMEIE